MAIWKTPAPGVVVLPNWDNVNQYEKERAVLLAESGYVAFAADIYGADLQEGLSDDVRSEQYSTYVNDMDLYVARMQRAVEQLQQVPEVDPNNIAIIGYCFGGTGAIQYAFSGRDDIKAVVPVHGGLTALPDITAPIAPYTLILSGGDDAARGNQTILEEALNMGNATWEITRYAFVEHGFTWGERNSYNLNADARSWESTMTTFEYLMPTPEKASFIDAAAATGNYDPLLDLVTTTPGVLDAITENVPVTVFGPNDDAFAAIADTLADLTEEQVANTLAGHVVAGEYRAADVVAAGCVELPTLNPEMKLKVSYNEADGKVMVNDVATVVEADLGGDSTGVLHGVDTVITDGFTPCPTSEPTGEPKGTTIAPYPAPTLAPTTSSAAEFTAAVGFLVSVLAGFVIA